MVTELDERGLFFFNNLFHYPVCVFTLFLGSFFPSSSLPGRSREPSAMSGKDAAGRVARTLARGRPLGGFPLPINVGIDVCAVDRVGAILGGRFGARFLRRVLAEEELQRDGKEERLRALREKYAGAGAWPYGGGGHREGDGDGKREGEGAVARRGAAEEVQAFARHVAGRCVSIFLSVCLYFSCCCCCCYSCSLAAAAVVVIILVVMRECRRLGVGGVAENRGYLFISRKETEKGFTKEKGNFEKMSFTNLNVFFSLVAIVVVFIPTHYHHFLVYRMRKSYPAPAERGIREALILC